MISGTYTCPDIDSFFNRILLSTPMFQPDAEYLRQFADWLERKINSREFRKFPGTLKRLMQQHELLMEMYERAKTQEKQKEGEMSFKTQKLFYRIKLPRKDDRDIFERLVRKRNTSMCCRRNYDISKI